MARAATLLRQVVVNHGHCSPSLPVGPSLSWLPQLLAGPLEAELDRRTVVLPRAGDGWYAPPPESASVESPFCVPAGFPWGELSTAGAEALRRRGRGLLPVPGPGSRDLASRLLVRAANRNRSVSAAQALVLGAAEVVQEASGRRPPPVEVLLQQGEDLLPRCIPGAPGFPSPGGRDPLLEAQQALERDLGAISAPLAGEGPLHADLARLAAAAAGQELGAFDALCEALVCVQGATEMGAQQPPAEQVDAVRRLNFLRWAAPIQAGGPEAAGAVIGPLLREIFRACDSAIEAGPDTPELVIYSTQADALTALIGALGLATAGAGDTELLRSLATWPDFEASLELELVQDAGEPFIRLLHNGRAVVPGMGRDIVPYSQVRARFEKVVEEAA